ncbi:Hypothetical protein A7982_08216 [Minicystis rosea]|nr:Hypothetical protein A7982_08216 [Minicystis rosea]
MSLDFFVALPGPPPTVARLSAALEAHGGAEGSWKEGVEAGGVRVSKLGDQEGEILAVVTRALAEAGKPPLSVATLLVYSGGGFQTQEDVGAALIGHAGGAIVTEDGELLHYAKARAAKKTAAKRQPPRSRVRARPRPRASMSRCRMR